MFQRMLPHHTGRCAALGFGRAHKILADGFQHGGTGQPHQLGAPSCRQRYYRQDIASPFGNPMVRQKPQLQAKHIYQHHSQEKTGDGRKQDGCYRTEGIRKGILSHRR